MKRLTVSSWHSVYLVTLSFAFVSGYGDFQENWKLFKLPDPTFPGLNDTLGFRVKGDFFKKFHNFTRDEATVLLFTNECSRYCIENVDKNVPYINLFWTTSSEDIKDRSLGKDDPQLLLKDKWPGASVRPRNCQIYLDLDCSDEIRTTTNPKQPVFRVNRENNDPDTIKITEKYNLSGESETKFLVNDSLQRVVINIDGNVTSGLLQLPIDATASRHGTAMSWVRKGNTEGVRVDTKNGPSGEWRVNLLGVAGSKYHVAALGLLSEGNIDGVFVPDLQLNDDATGNSISNYQSQPRNEPMETELIEETMDDEKQVKSARSSIESLDMGVKNPIEGNVSMKLTELSEELVSYASRNVIEERKMLIEVNRNSNLLAAPGTIHRVTFDVMNSCVLPVIYTFRAKSSPFRVYNVKPISAWIYPDQVTSVAVDLVVPQNAAPDTANTVSLSILGTEIKEKSAYIYVQGSLSKLTDDVKPVVEYSYNSNCAGKLDNDRCYKSRWSVDITIQDYDSGLKRVVSSLNDVYPRTEFISGTRSSVTFYYSATCCDKTVKITAIDLLNNYNTVTIDVTAWNNLSEAEIAAITVGALLALLLIIVIVVSIIYCVRRRKSHDLPYTQRYGSTRPPAQSERF